MGMMVNVVEDEELFCLVMNHPPSCVCVWMIGKPGRRLGVEVTTQDHVWYVCDLFKVWRVVLWNCGGGLWRDVCIGDCYMCVVSSANFDRLNFCCGVMWGKEGFCLRTGVDEVYVFVDQGDESTAIAVGPVLPDGGEIVK